MSTADEQNGHIFSPLGLEPELTGEGLTSNQFKLIAEADRSPTAPPEEQTGSAETSTVSVDTVEPLLSSDLTDGSAPGGNTESSEPIEHTHFAAPETTDGSQLESGSTTGDSTSFMLNALLAAPEAPSADAEQTSPTLVSTSSLLASTGGMLDIRVSSADDDVEERPSGGLSNNVSDLELGFNRSSPQTVGIRFNNLDIPQGAVITAAYIQFTADEEHADSTALEIRGDDSDNASPFLDIDHSVSGRATTDAFASWNPAAWTLEGAAGAAERTVDLVAIVQEIVNRSGWAPQNSMAFIITGTGTRTAMSFEADPNAAPLLHIEWSPPGDGSDPVAFNNPPDANGANNRIAELAAAGALVGITASASDPDPGDDVSYSVDDPRFSIDPSTGVISRSGTGALDFETESSITLAVTATSDDGSFDTHDFTIEVLNSDEPVVFLDPPDANGASDVVEESAAAGTTVGITASADDPDIGDTVSYTIDDQRFEIGSDGVVTRSGTGVLDATGEPQITLTVTASSTDGTSAVETFELSVTSGPPVGGTPTGLTLVNTVLTSNWSPPSPDASGIAYVDHLGTLFVSDGEVNEMSIFAGANMFQATLDGTLVDTYSTLSFSDEPAGLAYNPANRHLYFGDDTGKRGIYELNPGTDGLYMTADDVVTLIETRPIGVKDPEGLCYDTIRDVIWIAAGYSDDIIALSPGANGVFDGVPSTGGDDFVLTQFDGAPLGIHDPEGIEHYAPADVLFVIASDDTIAMITPDGDLLDMFDISAVDAKNPAGLAIAPSSADPARLSLYVAARGVDNNSDPNENDGKIYEFMIEFDPLLA